MSSAIASLGGPSLAQWVRKVSKGVSHAAAAISSGATSSTGPSGATAGGFLSQVQQAVTNALQSSSQSDGSANPNQVVQDAITQLLKNMGVGSGSAASATSSPATTTTAPTQGAPTQSADQAFTSLLQSVGITPQQFQADFQAAIENARGSTANSNTALGGLPIGSVLDITG